MSISPNTQPPFPDTLIVARGLLATANSDATGATTANMVTLYTNNTVANGGKGARFDRLAAKATAATAAAIIRFFLHDGTTNWPIPDEMLVTVVATPSATVQTWSGEITRSDGLPVVIVPPGYSLKCTTSVTQNISMTAWGGEY